MPLSLKESKMNQKFIVHIEIPQGSNKNRMKEYVEHALRDYSGDLSPEDPEFFVRTISVQPVTKKRVLRLLDEYNGGGNGDK
jgi:hypothetical protein